VSGSGGMLYGPGGVAGGSWGGRRIWRWLWRFWRDAWWRRFWWHAERWLRRLSWPLSLRALAVVFFRFDFVGNFRRAHR
jgi:hypothetical protein